MTSGTQKPGLRERKKQRTRASIVAAATKLFLEQGYEATTVAQIAEAADFAQSTVFIHFPTKADLVFSLLDALIANARERLLDDAGEGPAVELLVSWILDDLPGVEVHYVELLKAYGGLVEANAELAGEARLRVALLEDVFAELFARELDEPREGLRPHLLATITLRAIGDVWNTWLPLHEADADFDLHAVVALKADFVRRALDAAQPLVEQLPTA